MSDDGVRIAVEGLEAIVSALGKTTEQAMDISRLHVRIAALNVETGAKQRCPVGTPESTHKPGYHGGRLRASIRAEVAESLGLEDVAWRALTDVEYAPYVEQGTTKMAARPFLHPAFEEEMPKFLSRLQTALSGGLGPK